MNIKPLLFVILLIYCLNSTAQKISDASCKRFGFMAGMNLSNMNFNKGVPVPNVPVDATWKGGIIIGFLVNIPLAKNLFLQPEYYYTRRKGADKSIKTNYLADYFSLPVLLNYKVSSRLSILAGPQAEVLIHAKDNNHGDNRTITHDMEERSIGATAGLDFQLYKYFVLSARYMKGLNHIGIEPRENVKEFQYEVVNVMVGIRFF